MEERKTIQTGKPGRPALVVKSPHYVTHQPRPELKRGSVLRITLQMKDDVPSLAKAQAASCAETALRKFSAGENFSIVGAAIFSDRMELLVEANSKRALSHGMQMFGISLARRLDFTWSAKRDERVGRVYARRYEQDLLLDGAAVARVLGEWSGARLFAAEAPKTFAAAAWRAFVAKNDVPSMAAAH